MLVSQTILYISYYNINLAIHLVVCLSVYLHSQVHRTLELFNYLSFLNLRAAQGWAPWAADFQIGRNGYHIREKGEIRQGGEGRERTERREGLLLPRTAVILYTAPFCSLLPSADTYILVVTQELAPLKLSWSQPRSHRGVNGWVSWPVLLSFFWWWELTMRLCQIGWTQYWGSHLTPFPSHMWDVRVCEAPPMFGWPVNSDSPEPTGALEYGSFSTKTQNLERGGLTCLPFQVGHFFILLS